MAIGEAGSITTNSPSINTPITVNLTEPLTDPVIAMTATNNGGNQFALRVIDQTLDGDGNTTSFTFIIEEWEYLDGAHPATETINWIAVEEGVHTLPDGRVIEAGRTDTDGVGADSNVTFAADFDGNTPAVLTTVMSENDTTTVDSDPDNVTSTGFDIRLQEEEAEADDHANESIGWIAIETGGDADSGTASNASTATHNVTSIGLGDTFTDAIVVAETQTIDGPNTATVKIDTQSNSDVDLYLEEEQSQDTETNHLPETIGVVAFERGVIPCFLPGTRIATTRGALPVEDLRPGDLVLSRDHGPSPLLWLSHTRLSAQYLEQAPEQRPILVPRDAIAPGIPARDLTVSPQHRLLLEGWRAQLWAGEDEVLVPAKALLGMNGVRHIAPDGGLDYHHLLLDHHGVIEAEGTPSESLYAGEIDKTILTPMARAGLFDAVPDLRSAPSDFGPLARPSLSVAQSRCLAA